MYKKRDRKEAVREYVAIRSKLGDKAKSNSWIQRNGYSSLAHYIRRHFNSWSDFKKKAGFDDKPLHVSWTPELAIKCYKEIRNRHGDKAKNSNWIMKSSNNGLVQWVLKNFDSWSNFKKKAGFDDPLCFRTWTKELAIEEYRRVGGFTKDRVQKKKFLKDIGKALIKTKSSSWLAKNGHEDLLSCIRNKFDSWDNFKKQAEIKDK